VGEKLARADGKEFPGEMPMLGEAEGVGLTEEVGVGVSLMVGEAVGVMVVEGVGDGSAKRGTMDETSE